MRSRFHLWSSAGPGLSARRLKVLAAGFLLQAGANVHAYDGNEAIQARSAAAWALADQDFPKLERLRQAMAQTDELTASGTSKLYCYDKMIEDRLTDPRSHKDGTIGWVKLTEGWARTYPQSALAHIAYAQALRGYALSLRGTDDRNRGLPFVEAGYRDTLQKALKHLADHADVVSTDIAWQTTVLQLGTALGWPQSKLDQVFRDGLRRHPGDFRLYAVRMQTLSPRWGGTQRRLDDFINRSLRDVPSAQRPEFYVRLYMAAAEGEYGRALYRETLADWGRMKQGLTDLNKHYPTKFNHHLFAAQACLVRDKETAAAQLQGLSADEGVSAWGGSYNDRALFEECKKWAAGQRE